MAGIPFLFGLVGIIALTSYWLEPAWMSYVKYMQGVPYGSSIVNAIVPWCLAMLVYWGYGGFFLLVDAYQRPKALYATKLQPKAVNTVSLSDCVKQVLFNQILVLLPALLGLNLMGNLKITQELPSIFTVILHLTLTLLAGEVLYYYTHRILHTRWLYRAIHKRHHNYKAPIAIVSLYAHPLEVLFGNILSLIGPAFFLGLNTYTWYWAIVLGFIDSISDHVGYDVKGDFHDLHHQHTTYNYGSIGILDYLHGTYR